MWSLEFLETAVKHQRVFVSSSIHKSLDGVRVMNYAQWQSQENYQAFINNSGSISKVQNFPISFY